MPWLKIDDGFAENHKIAALSHPAFRLHVSAMCYSARTSSDGYVAAQAIRIIAATADIRQPKRYVDELVGARLWIAAADGHVINDWKVYNGTLPDRVAAYLERHPDATANEVYRVVGGERNAVLAEVKRQKTGTGAGINEPPEEPEPNHEAIPLDRFGNTETGGAGSGTHPSPPHPKGSKEEAPTKDQRHREGTLNSAIGQEYQLARLIAAMGGGDHNARKVANTLRRHTISEADLVATISACTGPGVADPVAVALAELSKRRHASKTAA